MQEIIRDSSTVTLRSIPDERIAALRQDARFQYEQNLELASSGWERFWEQLWNLLVGRYLDDTLQPIWEYLLYALITLVILYALYRLLGMRFSWLGYRKSVPVSYLEDLEMSPEIGNVAWEHRIKSAMEQGAYREAVRLYFLKALRYLVQEEKIHWQKFKTNQAYTYELKEQGLDGIFSRLVYIYEHVWYGQFAVSRPQVDEVRRHVEALMNPHGSAAHEKE